MAVQSTLFPYVFTKLMKPVVSISRRLGIRSVSRQRVDNVNEQRSHETLGDGSRVAPVTQATLLEESSKANEEPGEDHGAGVDLGNYGSCTPCNTPGTTPLQEPWVAKTEVLKGARMITE